MGFIIGILVRLIIGFILISKAPEWIKATGTLASLIRLLGVLIIISIVFMFI